VVAGSSKTAAVPGTDRVEQTEAGDLFEVVLGAKPEAIDVAEGERGIGKMPREGLWLKEGDNRRDDRDRAD